MYLRKIRFLFNWVCIFAEIFLVYGLAYGGVHDIADINKRQEQHKKLERKNAEFIKKIKEKIGSRIAKLGIPKPWVSPPKIKTAELPLALQFFPKDSFGYPDWAAAARKNLINPREYIFNPKEAEEEDKEYDKDIIFKLNDDVMPDVLFSHKTHNFWLSCKNCHPSIFIDKKGGNNFDMFDIWRGKYCGRCHGKVSFMPKGIDNCRRCHSK